jgi:hypothetical protein
MKTLLFIVALIVSLSSYGGTRDPKVPDQNYVDYGSKFKCVVPICGVYDNNEKYCASGVAIKPRWILTAAHVIKSAKTCNIKINNEIIEASKIIPHADFNSDSFGYYDIGLIYFEKDLSLDVYAELYIDKDEIGKICGISGYGITGTFEQGSIISDSQKRGGSNKINYIDKHLLICNLTDTYTPLEFLIASGDSGGGLFINQKLAGINSCVLAADKNPNSNYGDESGHTRVSEHISWINTEIKNYEQK